MRPVPRARVTSWRTTARPRPVVVATAAPVTPSAGKRPEAEDEARVEDEVADVREPEDAHRDRRVAGAAEDRVDEEEEHDHDVAAEHHGREPRARGDDVGSRAHEGEKARGQRGADDAEGDRERDAERNRLHGRARGPLAVPLADPPRDHRGRGHREPDRERVEDRRASTP